MLKSHSDVRSLLLALAVLTVPDVGVPLSSCTYVVNKQYNGVISWTIPNARDISALRSTAVHSVASRASRADHSGALHALREGTLR